MKKISRILLTILLVGCSANEEYSQYACRFSYDNSLYLDATLASAMNSQSRGVFCHISETTEGGAVYLVFRDNLGSQPTRKQEMAQERQAQYILGLNNGIIVGFQTLNQSPNGGFVAYDAQCSNCVRESGNTINPKFPLQMSPSGIATCGKCSRQYDMNNSGIVQNGQQGDVALERYVATTTGPMGFISVTRR